MKDLLTVLLKTSEVFLSDMEEFFPFGVIKNMDGTLSPVQFYDENLDAKEFLKGLKRVFGEQLMQNEIDAASIAVNVVIKNKDGQKLYDAVQILTSEDGKNWKKELYPYKLEQNRVKWIKYKSDTIY